MSDKTPGLTAHTTDELLALLREARVWFAAGLMPIRRHREEMLERIDATLRGEPGTGPTGPDALRRMTAEAALQWCAALLNSIRGQKTEADALHILSVALVSSRAEGKAEGLEEAARIADVEAEHYAASSRRCDTDGNTAGGLIDAASSTTCSRIAARIRSLIPAAPGENTK